MDVPRYRSPRLFRRALKITAFVWLVSVGYSAATGVWAYAWWNPLFWVTLMALGMVLEHEQRLMTRWAIDRLQARLANKRERRRAMKANQGSRSQTATGDAGASPSTAARGAWPPDGA